ncbi:Glutamate 2,3-aminomutase [anaerobic digester metagenome]
MDKNARDISLERADVLKSKIQDYLDIKDTIPSGLTREPLIAERKRRIMDALGAEEANWNDWHWQVSARVRDSQTLEKIIPLTPKQKEEIDRVGKKFRWAISPHFLSLIGDEDPLAHYENPVFLQSIPIGLELTDSHGKADPMGEEYTNPAECITRRYADRLIIYATNQCGMYCRHCQRRRNIGEFDRPSSQEALEQALEYIRNNPEIRDVLITGGDPLTLSDERLDWLLSELDAIEHVEIKRIGTRMPITIPQRVTPELTSMLRRHHPLFINIQCNHPLELTQDVKEALGRLSDAGIPLGNQAVLLKGINDDPHIMKKLNQDLLRCRVKPYYIFHAKEVIGTEHFRTSVDRGIEIMEYLVGYTSGMARPTFIVNAPDGYGKTPMLPEYKVSRGRDKLTLRTWEGRIFEYPNKDFEGSIRDLESIE